MSKSSKFYLPLFKTGKPNSKLYSYLTGTSTPSSLFDKDGIALSNPAIMDDNGNLDLYMNKDIEYRLVLKSNDDTITYFDLNNIKQLNGSPGTPGGPQGPDGNQGKQGPQGISGIQGEKGETGNTGNKGLSYLNRIVLTGANQTITIPKGVSEIYVTASGGGGAAASYARSFYIFENNKVLTDLIGFAINTNQVQRTSDSAILSSTPVYKLKQTSLSWLYLFPGTGFAGQSVYRKKISLNSSIENVLDIFVGGGGSRRASGLNGGPGGSTALLINGAVALSLSGGLGGAQQLPDNPVGVIEVNTASISQNFGYCSGVAYHQDSDTGGTFVNPSPYQTSYFFNTSYKKISGLSYVLENIKYSYNKFTYRSQTPQFNFCPLADQNKSQYRFGGHNVFGDYYTQTQSVYNSPSITDATSKMDIKSFYGNNGYGAGGNIYFNTENSLGTTTRYYFDQIFEQNPSKYLNLFIKDRLQDMIITQMQQFSATGSYSLGLSDIPAKTDATFWTELDSIKTYLQTLNDPIYEKPGIQNPKGADTLGIFKIWPAELNNLDSGNGVQGVCIIEYGDIKDNSI